jgi:hypothetical protein
MGVAVAWQVGVASGSPEPTLQNVWVMDMLLKFDHYTLSICIKY